MSVNDFNLQQENLKLILMLTGNDQPAVACIFQ
jgi:hypothetical protein